MKSLGVYTFQEKITIVLTRLRGCADLSAPLLFAHMLRNEVHQSSLGIIGAQTNILHCIFTFSTGVQRYLDIGVPANTLVLGVPWYGYHYPCLAMSAVRFCYMLLLS